MYNINFLNQLEGFKEDLWGDRHFDTRDLSEQEKCNRIRQNYSWNVKCYPCKEDVNGEYVPVRESIS